jgi:hypothetical protein
MRREKKRLEDEQRYFAARDLLREKRQKNSLLLPRSGCGSESGGCGLAVSSGPRSPVNSSSGDRQFNLRLQQLVALNALKGGSNG